MKPIKSNPAVTLTVLMSLCLQEGTAFSAVLRAPAPVRGLSAPAGVLAPEAGAPMTRFSLPEQNGLNLPDSIFLPATPSVAQEASGGLAPVAAPAAEPAPEAAGEFPGASFYVPQVEAAPRALSRETHAFAPERAASPASRGLSHLAALAAEGSRLQASFGPASGRAFFDGARKPGDGAPPPMTAPGRRHADALNHPDAGSRRETTGSTNEKDFPVHLLPDEDFDYGLYIVPAAGELDPANPKRNYWLRLWREGKAGIFGYPSEPGTSPAIPLGMGTWEFSGGKLSVRVAREAGSPEASVVLDFSGISWERFQRELHSMNAEIRREGASSGKAESIPILFVRGRLGGRLLQSHIKQLQRQAHPVSSRLKAAAAWTSDALMRTIWAIFGLTVLVLAGTFLIGLFVNYPGIMILLTLALIAALTRAY